VDNIRMDIGEVGWGDVDWIGMAQDRNRWRALVNSVLNLRVPWNSGKLSSGLTTGSLSSSAQLHRVSRFGSRILSPYSYSNGSNRKIRSLSLILNSRDVRVLSCGRCMVD
jgi:hypothetical protein